MMADPVGRANFHQLLAEVSAHLNDGHYRPGDRIGIKELAIHMKASTTPLREVLSRLVGRGIVEERRSEGYYLARLDARDIADLYALHGICVERAMYALRQLTVPDGDPASIWLLFEQIAQASGDHILSDVRLYLDDRLRVVRRCEARLFGDTKHDALTLHTLIAAARLDEAGFEIRLFHQRRQEAAHEIAVMLARVMR